VFFKRCALLVTALVAIASGGHAEQLIDQNTVRLTSPRTSAVGGVHAALADDYTTLFSNPAGLAATESQLRVAELTLGLHGPIFSISSLVFEGVSGDDISELISSPDVSDLLSALYASTEVIGPLSFGYVGEGLGFGVTAGTDVTATSGTSSGVSVSIRERVLLTGGFALPVPIPAAWNGTLDAGVLLKGFVSGEGGFQSSLLDLPDVLGDLGPDLIIDEPFDITTGIGIDAGFRYTYGERLAVGLSAANLVAPTVTNEYASLDAFLDNEQPTGRPDGRIPQDISIGFLYKPPLGPVSRYISDVTLLLDYRDMLDFWVAPETAENPLLKVGVGAEIDMLQVLSVRAGLSQGLFAAGLGVDLSFMKFDISVYGTERSIEPGLDPTYNVAAGFTVSR
jgi:hypothetical protein